MLDDRRSLATTRTLAVAAGRHVTDDPLPVAPWDVSGTGVVVSASLAAGDDAGLLDAVVRGAGAIVATTGHGDLPARLVDALQRVGRVVDARRCPALQLDQVQVRLLVTLAHGGSTSDAARAAYLSLRTAHRRIAEARRALGASNTGAATAAIDQALRFWVS